MTPPPPDTSHDALLGASPGDPLRGGSSRGGGEDLSRRVDLVMEGGGVKGIALAGALEVLEERVVQFYRRAGCTAGATAGTFAPAGLPARTIVENQRGPHYRQFEDGSWWTRSLLGKGAAILLHNGIHRGTYLTGWLEEQL